jgi:hypothetical protein
MRLRLSAANGGVGGKIAGKIQAWYHGRKRRGVWRRRHAPPNLPSFNRWNTLTPNQAART